MRSTAAAWLREIPARQSPPRIDRTCKAASTSALSAKRSGPAGKAADPSGNESEPYTDLPTRKAIERALTETWNLREVNRYVDKAIAALEPSAAKKVCKCCEITEMAR